MGAEQENVETIIVENEKYEVMPSTREIEIEEEEEDEDESDDDDLDLQKLDEIMNEELEDKKEIEKTEEEFLPQIYVEPPENYTFEEDMDLQNSEDEEVASDEEYYPRPSSDSNESEKKTATPVVESKKSK